MIFTIIADISIMTLNLSLMLNTVSFYQVGRPAGRGRRQQLSPWGPESARGVGELWSDGVEGGGGGFGLSAPAGTA